MILDKREERAAFALHHSPQLNLFSYSMNPCFPFFVGMASSRTRTRKLADSQGFLLARIGSQLALPARNIQNLTVNNFILQETVISAFSNYKKYHLPKNDLHCKKYWPESFFVFVFSLYITVKISLKLDNSTRTRNFTLSSTRLATRITQLGSARARTS